MRNIQEVIKDLESINMIVLDHLCQCASNLMTLSRDKAEGVSLEEMDRRVEIALRALRADDVSTSGAAVTTEKAPLQIAQQLVNSLALKSDVRHENFRELLEVLQRAQVAMLEPAVDSGEGERASVDSTAQPNYHSGVEAAKKFTELRTYTSNDPAVLEKHREEKVAEVLSDELTRDVVAAIIHFSDERFARSSAQQQAAIEHNAKLSWFGKLFFGKKVFDPKDDNFAFSREMDGVFGTAHPEGRQAYDEAVERLIAESLICHEVWFDGYGNHPVGLRVTPRYKQKILNFLANQDKAD